MTGSGAQASRQEAIDRGRAAYLNDRTKHAIVHFSKVINSCPCSQAPDVARSKCACKDYANASKRSLPYGLVDEITRPCTCSGPGRIYSACSDALHNRALDYRAACYEVLDKLEQARRDAEWALELDPLRLESYLRFAKVARRQGLPALAWQIYNVGVHVGRHNGLAGEETFRKLLIVRQPLQAKLYRADPLHLPTEIIESIFSDFDTRQLCACLRVSKKWFRALTGRTILWRDLSFDPKARAVPGLNSVRRIVKYSSNDMRSLTIANTNRFNLEAKFPALLNASRNTTHLNLFGLPMNAGDGLRRADWTFTKVTRLTLASHMFQRDSVKGPTDTNLFLSTILERSIDHLEYLSITTDHVNFGPKWPVLAKLKYLKIVETLKSTVPGHINGRHNQVVTLPLLWTKTPNLEQLWLEVFKCTYHPLDDGTSWPRLRCLVVGEHIRWPSMGVQLDKLRFFHGLGKQGPLSIQAFPDLPLPPDPIDLADIDFDFDPAPPPPPAGSLAQLEHMYHPHFTADDRAVLQGADYIRQGVRRALGSGRLQTLAFLVQTATDDPDYMSHFQWLRGSASVRALTVFLCSAFAGYPGDFAATTRFNRHTDMRDVGELVRSFPNLETLEVLTDDQEDLTSTLGMLIEAAVGTAGAAGPTIKTVYQEKLLGVQYDRLKAYLHERGAELRYGRIPQPAFPVKLADTG